MTARTLYDKHCRASKTCHSTRWDGTRYVLVFPPKIPVAYDFLSGNEKGYWSELARLVTPRRRSA